MWGPNSFRLLFLVVLGCFLATGQTSLADFFQVGPGTRERVVQLCSRAGGQIASIHNADEAAAARSVCENTPCYIGFTWDAKKSAWSWMDGSSHSYSKCRDCHSQAQKQAAAIGLSDDQTWVHAGDGEQPLYGICRREQPTSSMRQVVSCDEGYFLEGVSCTPCPVGSYCNGVAKDNCECDPGYYCPAKYTPVADAEADAPPEVSRRAGGYAETGNPLHGRPCPPGSVCAGDDAAPVPAGSVCDLVQACAGGACGAAQSTFLHFEDFVAAAATDTDPATCARTADALADPNPQWVRVDLGQERVVETVRFTSAEGRAGADFAVGVFAEDYAPVLSASGGEVANPSAGGAVPLEEVVAWCGVSKLAGREFEAACPEATKGRFVFIRAAAAAVALDVCGVEAFAHVCEELPEGQAERCPIGFEPATQCAADASSCRGCVPCTEGSYSDKEGSYACTPCPGLVAYGERPYSPRGSTSEFQCEGDAVLDGTSTLDVDQVAFNQSLDAWQIDIAVSVGAKVQINGLAALYMSAGGAAVDPRTYRPAEFPCRADTSAGAGADLSASLSETVCCLQSLRQSYVMTQTLREFTDGLELVAANDVCDAEDGSNELVNADLEVWGEGTQFVDVEGNAFRNAITVEPLPGPVATEERRDGDSYYTGVQYARITIPDAELYKVSRSLNPEDELTDTRELFVGLLDMLPTGTRVVDSSNQQIKIELTRTQYGTFAAYGEQNIDYDFISYLNARVHKVGSTTEAARRELVPDQYYLEVTYVYDDRLRAADAAAPVEDLGSVMVNDAAACLTVDPDFAAVVGGQTSCGPQINGVAWGAGGPPCPQVSLPDDHVGRLYIPLAGSPGDGTIAVEFALNFTDAANRTAELEVRVDVAVGRYVSWCDADSGSIDLAERVIPSITIGSESDNPPRLYAFGSDDEDFSTGAETIQDGLVTLLLALNETDGLADNLEVFIEDVLVVHVNPGSDPDFDTIKAGLTGASPTYMPTYTYDPDTRDATLNIPPALAEDCKVETGPESFFGCVHKHIVADEVITDPTEAYLLGSAMPPEAGAQDFMQAILGSGTAAASARELGRDFEEHMVAAEELVVDGKLNPKRVGLLINPGHRWGEEVHNGEYSLSQHLVIYVLYGVRSGVTGETRRMLLAASGGDGSRTQTLRYEVTARGLVERMLGNVVAVEAKAKMSLPSDEACESMEALREVCARELEAAVQPHASPVALVKCIAVDVESVDCDNVYERQRGGKVIAEIDAVIALESAAVTSKSGVFIDLDAVVAAGSVLELSETAGLTFEQEVTGSPSAPTGDADEEEEEEDDEDDDAEKSSGGGVNAGVVGGSIAGAGSALVLLWFAWTMCRRRGDQQPQPGAAVARTRSDPRSASPPGSFAAKKADRLEQLAGDYDAYSESAATASVLAAAPAVPAARAAPAINFLAPQPSIGGRVREWLMQGGSGRALEAPKPPKQAAPAVYPGPGLVYQSPVGGGGGAGPGTPMARDKHDIEQMLFNRRETQQPGGDLTVGAFKPGQRDLFLTLCDDIRKK